ncbi:hypothetical protein FLA_0554 [Filimonas lacunae]|nr:hypothetical protein FLA_0554 [Filimonas lacunae]
MSIAFHLNEINNLFVIEGQLNNYNWETFNKGQNYRAFLVTRK